MHTYLTPSLSALSTILLHTLCFLPRSCRALSRILPRAYLGIAQALPSSFTLATALYPMPTQTMPTMTQTLKEVFFVFGILGEVTRVQLVYTSSPRGTGDRQPQQCQETLSIYCITSQYTHNAALQGRIRAAWTPLQAATVAVTGHDNRGEYIRPCRAYAARPVARWTCPAARHDPPGMRLTPGWKPRPIGRALV